jgi:rhamnosyl/mannosyltransferase
MAAIAVFIARPKCKIVLHWHSDIIRQKLLYFLYKPLENWILKRADVIIGTSQNYTVGSKPLSKYLNKTFVIPLGISTERFVIDTTITSEIRKKYENKKIVFSLGRLVYYKGFDCLIESAKHLDDDVVVLIGGEGELAQALLKQIRKQGLSNKVHLLGRISDDKVAAYYQSCDVFCLPSTKRSEAFGVVQLEAMFFSKPIVATNIPDSGVSWVNQNNVTGFNVPTDDPVALARTITRILSDKRLAKDLSKNSKMRFDGYFTRTIMVSSIIELYHKLGFFRKPSLLPVYNSEVLKA